METLKLTICHYLNCESHIHLGVLHKTNAKSEKRTEFWTLRRVVTCYNCRNANEKRRRPMVVFTGNVLSIPSGKVLDKNFESLY